MSIKDFLEKYPIYNLINNDKTIDRVDNAYWFSFCNGDEKKNYDERKTKSYNYLDVVFFGIKNFEFSRKDFEKVFGHIKIELSDEKKRVY